MFACSCSGHSRERHEWTWISLTEESERNTEIYEIPSILPFPFLGFHFPSSTWKAKASSGNDLDSSQQHWNLSRTTGVHTATLAHFLWDERSSPDGCLCVFISTKDISFLKTPKEPPSFSYVALDFSFLINLYHPFTQNFFFLHPYLLSLYSLSHVSLQKDLFSALTGFPTTPATFVSYSLNLTLPCVFPENSPLPLCILLSSPHLPPCSVPCTFTYPLFTPLTYNPPCYTALYIQKDLPAILKPHFLFGCFFLLQIFLDHVCVWTTQQDLDMAISV